VTGSAGPTGATGATGSVSAGITVVYETGSGPGNSVTASCPPGDVALGGGGKDDGGGAGYTLSGPVNSTTPIPPAGSGSYAEPPTGWYFSDAGDPPPVTAYVICGH
jgi:hypothetical protein